jgi:hypothetical protein
MLFPVCDEGVEINSIFMFVNSPETRLQRFLEVSPVLLEGLAAGAGEAE